MAKTSLFIVANEARKGYVMVVVVVIVVVVVVVVVGSTTAPKRCRVYHGFFLLRLFSFFAFLISKGYGVNQIIEFWKW